MELQLRVLQKVLASYSHSHPFSKETCFWHNSTAGVVGVLAKDGQVLQKINRNGKSLLVRILENT